MSNLPPSYNTIIHHEEDENARDPVAAALDLQLQLQDRWHLDGQTRRTANLHWRMMGDDTVLLLSERDTIPSACFLLILTLRFRRQYLTRSYRWQSIACLLRRINEGAHQLRGQAGNNEGR